MSEPSSNPQKRSSSSLIDVRLKKLEDLVEAGIQPYTSGFSPDIHSAELKSKYSGISETDEISDIVRLAGRIMAIRILGKASFMRVHDVSGDFQIYLGRDIVGSEEYNRFKKLDIGDIVGVSGTPFKTKTGEITVLVRELVLLTKSIRPLPEKWHGLSDVEIRYRQRYLDLMVNQASREIVVTRSRIVSYLRKFLTTLRFSGSRNSDDANHTWGRNCPSI